MKKSIKLASVLVCALGMSGATFAALDTAQTHAFEIAAHAFATKGDLMTPALNPAGSGGFGGATAFAALGDGGAKIQKGKQVLLTYQLKKNDGTMMENGGIPIKCTLLISVPEGAAASKSNATLMHSSNSVCKNLLTQGLEFKKSLNGDF